MPRKDMNKSDPPKTVCSGCNRSQFERGQEFCMHCGAPLVRRQADPNAIPTLRSQYRCTGWLTS